MVGLTKWGGGNGYNLIHGGRDKYVRKLYHEATTRFDGISYLQNLIAANGIHTPSPSHCGHGTNKNRDVGTGPLAHPFARPLAPLTRSLAPHCSLRSRPPLRSLVRSLAHFAHSLARGKVNYQMAILSVFFPIFDHSGA